jgi:hypothetical protein
VVAGTWVLKGDELTVGWFGESGTPPRSRLEREVARLGRILGRELSGQVTTV